jgi:hypothetical protein
MKVEGKGPSHFFFIILLQKRKQYDVWPLEPADAPLL